AEPRDGGRTGLVLAGFVAARAYANGDGGVDPLLDIPDDSDHLFGPLDGHLDLDDRGEDLLIEDVLADVAGGRIGHQAGDRVVLLERNARRGERAGHLLDLVEARADAGATKFDREPDLADADAIRHVVGLYLLGAAPDDAGRFMRHPRVGKGAPHDT